MPFFLVSVHANNAEAVMSGSVSTPVPGVVGQSSPAIRTHRLGDGLVVRLSGVLDGQAIPALREGLLAPIPDGCREVLVDAGAVDEVDDEALAVLVAGSSWANSAGSRFALSAVSAPVARQIQALDLTSALPVLGSVE
jgi:anti-anti-sigma factor